MISRLILYIRIFALFWILISNSCNTGDDIIPILEIPETIDSVFELKEWLLIGPFSKDTLFQQNQKIYKNADELKMGFNEFGININTINKLITSGRVPFYANRVSSLIDFSDYFNGKYHEKSVFFSYTNILCEKERELILVCDGASSYTIWINGVIVCEVKEKDNISKIADKFVKIKLKKGKNLVFAKIKSGKVPQSWKLLIGLTNTQYAKTLYLKNYVKDFIYNPVVISDIAFYTGPFDKGTVLVFKNQDSLNFNFSEKDIKDGYLNITLPDSMEEGFYKCTIKLDDNILEENFFKGNLSNYYQNNSIQNEIDNFDRNTILDLQLADKLTIDFLNTVKQKKNKNKLNLFNYNSIFWYYNLVEALEYAKQNGNLKNKHGTTIKTFLDQKTGYSVNFLFHVSKKIIEQKKSFPLIIVPICETMGDSRQTRHLDDHSQLYTDRKLADERGFAICWIYIASVDSGIRNSSIAINKVLDKLIEDYPTIDKTNVYLYGESTSGQRAMLLAQMQPHKYAGIAIQNPFVGNEKNIGVQFETISNLFNMNILMIHSQKFTCSSLKHFRTFIKEGNTLALKKLLYKQFENIDFSIEYKKPCFDFFEKAYKTPTVKLPYYLRFKTSDNFFNESYGLKFTPKDTLTKTDIIVVFYPNTYRLKIYCENIQTMTINASILGINKQKFPKFHLSDKLKNGGYNEEGDIEISF
jgi:hypothetical protein